MQLRPHNYPAPNYPATLAMAWARAAALTKSNGIGQDYLGQDNWKALDPYEAMVEKSPNKRGEPTADHPLVSRLAGGPAVAHPDRSPIRKMEPPVMTPMGQMIDVSGEDEP